MGIFSQAIKQNIKRAKRDAAREKKEHRKATPLMDKMLAGQIESQAKIEESLRKIAPKSKHDHIEPPDWWPEIPIVKGAETMPGLSNILKPLLSLQIEARDQQILRALKQRGIILNKGERIGQQPSDNF